MLMRPKSRATVVLVLPSTPVTSSTPTLPWVRTSSVVNGGISLTDPTKVVLPVPKPPATTTLTDLRPIDLSFLSFIVSRDGRELFPGVHGPRPSPPPVNRQRGTCARGGHLPVPSPRRAGG